ncbi:hypothetical protein B1690_02120 [Geobacillus sp. 46C-IIa]|nr:hypothetical protein B1690_02120 [Geobacillus sp. 46C-IIa]
MMQFLNLESSMDAMFLFALRQVIKKNVFFTVFREGRQVNEQGSAVLSFFTWRHVRRGSVHCGDDGQ